MMPFVWFVVPQFAHSGICGGPFILFLAMYTLGRYIGLHPTSFDGSAKHYGTLTLTSVLCWPR